MHKKSIIRFLESHTLQDHNNRHTGHTTRSSRAYSRANMKLCLRKSILPYRNSKTCPDYPHLQAALILCLHLPSTALISLQCKHVRTSNKPRLNPRHFPYLSPHSDLLQPQLEHQSVRSIPSTLFAISFSPCSMSLQFPPPRLWYMSVTTPPLHSA